MLGNTKYYFLGNAFLYLHDRSYFYEERYVWPYVTLNFEP